MNGAVRPRLRRLAIGVFVLALPVAAHQIWDYVELRRLVAEIQAIIDRGEPVTAQDAGLEYEPWPTQAGERFAGTLYIAGAVLASTEVVDFNARELLYAAQDWLRGRSNSPEPHVDATVLSGLKSSLALELADKGALLPFRGFPGGTDYSSRSAYVSHLSVLVAARTVALSLAGDGGPAVESALTALRFRRATDETGFPANGGHETAAVLSWSRPSAEMLVRLQEALEQEEPPDRERGILLRIRAGLVEDVWRRYYGTNPTVPHIYSLPRRSIRESIVRPLITRRLVDVLRVWVDLVDLAGRPWSQHAEAVEEIVSRHQVEGDERSSALLRPFSFALMKNVAIERFDLEVRPDRLLEDRAARVAVAIARFQRDHDDALPEALSELVPGYLAGVPQDPLTDEPLRYRQDADAYVIYSVGPDGSDDGGTLTPDARPGDIRRFVPGRDIGVRVLIGRQRTN